MSPVRARHDAFPSVVDGATTFSHIAREPSGTPAALAGLSTARRLGRGSSYSRPMRYQLDVHDEDDGMLWATVEGLPGCFASGTDEAELRDAAAEAVAMIL